MYNTQNVCAVVLAAGKGTRMGSESPKVITNLKEKPLIHYVLDSLIHSGINDIIVVVGYKKDLVISSCQQYKQVRYIEQKEQLGTGHALLCTEGLLSSFQGKVLVACGDVPLIHSNSFKALINKSITNNEYVTVLSAEIEDPSGYGRVLRDTNSNICGIVEHKDSSEIQKKIREINTGTYIFQSPDVFTKLKQIGTQNAQGEYYLPDLVKIYYSENKPCGVIKLENYLESSGINSPKDLEYVSSLIDQGQVTVW